MVERHHQCKDQATADVRNQNDDQRANNRFGNTFLWAMRFFASRGNYVKSDEGVEACGGAGEHLYGVNGTVFNIKFLKFPKVVCFGLLQIA